MLSIYSFNNNFDTCQIIFAYSLHRTSISNANKYYSTKFVRKFTIFIPRTENFKSKFVFIFQRTKWICMKINQLLSANRLKIRLPNVETQGIDKIKITLVCVKWNIFNLPTRIKISTTSSICEFGWTRINCECYNCALPAITFWDDTFLIWNRFRIMEFIYFFNFY